MKITREARQEARSLYRSCLVDGQLDSARLQAVVSEVLQRQPRGYLAIVERIKALVALEVNRRTHVVRSAVVLVDGGESIFRRLAATFGAPLARYYHVNPELIGGLSIQVGSDIWDGSVQRKLRLLAPTAN